MVLAGNGAAPGRASRQPTWRSGRWSDVRDRSGGNSHTRTVGLRVEGYDPSQVQWFSGSLPPASDAYQTTSADGRLAGGGPDDQRACLRLRERRGARNRGLRGSPCAPRKGHRAPRGLTPSVQFPTPNSQTQLPTSNSQLPTSNSQTQLPHEPC